MIVAPTAGDTTGAAGLGTADLQLRTSSGDVGVAAAGPGESFGALVVYLQSLSPSVYDVYRGDVDGDARADLVSRRKDNGVVEVFVSNGTQYIARGQWGSGWGTSYDLYLADVNGDGKDDLIARLQSTGEVFVSVSNGQSFGSPSTWSSG